MLGIGLALRGLFQQNHFDPTRNEMIAFFNTLDKWTESIQIIELMKEETGSWTRWRIGAVTVLLIVLPELLHAIMRYCARRRGSGQVKEKQM